MSASFDISRPARVTVGAVGPPGKRVFYLQARQGDELVSLKLEKEQVLFLAGGLTQVMADLAAPSSVPAEDELALEEPVEPAWSVGSMQLAYDPASDRVVLVAHEIPVPGAVTGDEEAEDPQGAGAGAGAGEGEGTGEGEGAEDEPPPEDDELIEAVAELDEQAWLEITAEALTAAAGGEHGVARVLITREQAAGMIEHGKRLLRGGRPSCPYCGYPLEEGHSCPKLNGHRAPSP